MLESTFLNSFLNDLLEKFLVYSNSKKESLAYVDCCVMRHDMNDEIDTWFDDCPLFINLGEMWRMWIL